MGGFRGQHVVSGKVRTCGVRGGGVLGGYFWGDLRGWEEGGVGG